MQWVPIDGDPDADRGMLVDSVQILFGIIAKFKRAHDQVKHNKTILELLREHVDLVEDSLREINDKGLTVNRDVLEPFQAVLEECFKLVEDHVRVDQAGLVERAIAYLRDHLRSRKVMTAVTSLNQRLVNHSRRLQATLMIQTLAWLQDMPNNIPHETVEKDERQNCLYFGREMVLTKDSVETSIRRLVEDVGDGMACHVNTSDVCWSREGHQRVVIGEGGMGKVYRAKWKGRDVAVKELPVGDDLLEPDSYSEFLSEINFFTKMQHKNVVTLHGVSTTAQPYLMVMEYAPKGNLESLRHGAQGSIRSWAAKVQLLLDAAQGLDHLHALRIAHKNLKSSDLLVFPNPHAISGYTVKVSDFGLVTTRTKTRALTRRGGSGWGSSSLSPPEFAEGYTYGWKSDVFAFGVVMYEFVGRRPPPMRYGSGNLRPQDRVALEKYFRVAEGCPEALKEAMAACCRNEPHSRPRMMQVVDRLAKLLRCQLTKAMGR